MPRYWACPSCARKRSRAGAPSTTTARSRACACWTATPFEIKLGQAAPRFLLNLTDSAWAGAVAREVVEFYGERIAEHPVGTGPFRLAAWLRASKIVLEKNPNYRERYYDETAQPGDAMAAAAVAALKGKRLPLVDRVEISIIEESQPRWLAFLNGEHELIEDVPAAFASIAMPPAAHS